jgi:polyvinyl alcohol dehydrogenase (cytochrome)
LFGNLGHCLTSPACAYDTAQGCSVNADCTSCIPAVGGGVTATAAVDETGETVYMASVGCLSFPSVGNSDAIFSLDAATGSINWVYRTQTIQQIADGPYYYDYGFLNGPILAEVDDGLGGTQKIVAAGSKDGSFYAVDRDTGSPVWTNVLAPAPSFAEFGLFNGPDAFADGMFFGALYQFANWPGANDHLYALDGMTGGTVWSDQIGPSWSATTVANGVLYAGTQSAKEFYAYDAVTGVRLRTFVLPTLGTLPDNVSGGAAVVGDTLYVPYGVFGNKGGVLAYKLPD